MKKLILTSFVAVAAITGAANAAEFKPYVSEKISFGQMDLTNAKSTAQASNTADHTNATGKDAKDTFWGSKTAVGVSFPVEKIYGSVRAELEFGINTKAEMDIENSIATSEKYATSIKTQTYGLNAYYDINTNSAFTPYIGAGIALAHIAGNTEYKSLTAPGAGTAGDIKSDNFGWNVGAGVAYAITEALSADLSYRYSNLGSVKDELKGYGAFAGNNYDMEAKLSSHEVLLGVRYAF
ncbi:MAG: outer membrane beta-barrel protein [Rickettsiales bacterium]|jgi:opacity protein-like surface antigen|nr:outer membrane beta-barrel protein [Rickettsiales bacterium]